MKVHFVQTGFENRGGHYLLETRAWRRAVLGAGLEWRGFANAKLDAQTAKASDVVALFPHGPHGVIDQDPVSREITDLLYYSEHFSNAAVLIREVREDDLAIIEFANAAQIYGCARWLRQLAPEQRPRLAIVIHVPDNEWQIDRARNTLSGRISAWRFAINQLKVSLPESKLCVCAIDARLASYLGNILNVSVHPTPLVSWFDPAVIAAPPEPEFDLLFAGGMRIDKGSDFIIEVLKGLRDTGSGLKVGIQVESKESAQGLLQQVGGVGALRLDFAIGPLDPAHYIARLTRSRVVVLPYRSEHYAARASGIASEAFGYGLPIVAPSDTWISDRLSDGSGAGATFDTLNASSVVKAANLAIQNWPSLRAAALKSAPAWREKNSAETALKQMRATLSI